MSLPISEREDSGGESDQPGGRCRVLSAWRRTVATSEVHACELGLAFACTRVGLLYHEGRVPADARKAQHYFERAGQLDSAYSCARLKR